MLDKIVVKSKKNKGSIGFEKELEKLINHHCMENGCDTPDFILAAYLKQCLIAFNVAVNCRDQWYGRPLGKPLFLDDLKFTDIKDNTKKIREQDTYPIGSQEEVDSWAYTEKEAKKLVKPKNWKRFCKWMEGQTMHCFKDGSCGFWKTDVSRFIDCVLKGKPTYFD